MDEKKNGRFLPKAVARMTVEEKKYAERQNTEGRMLKRRERKMPNIKRGAETEKRKRKGGEDRPKADGVWHETQNACVNLLAEL